MIRRAKFEDVPAIAEMLREMHGLSKYAGRVEICEKTMGTVLLAMVAAQNQNGPQASYCVIAEVGKRPVGFMIGVLDRVYHIGNKLTAKDAYLYAREGAPPRSALAMVRGYVDWALANPKVIDMILSWVDTLPEAHRVAALYQHVGFEKVGEIYERRKEAK